MGNIVTVINPIFQKFIQMHHYGEWLSLDECVKLHNILINIKLRNDTSFNKIFTHFMEGLKYCINNEQIVYVNSER